MDASLAEELSAREEARAQKEEELRRRLERKRRKQVRRASLRRRAGAVPARVARVHLEGLGRTRPEAVEAVLGPLFAAANYGEVLASVRDVHGRLKSLGCFEKVDLLLDVSEETKGGVGSPPTLLDVTVSATELRWVSLGLEPRASDLGDAQVVGRICLPNLFGGGENLKAEVARTLFDRGCESRSLTLSRQRPLSSVLCGGELALVARAAWDRGQPVAWRGRGVLASASWNGSVTALVQPFSWLQQRLTLSAALRRVVPAATAASIPFEALKECGHTMKTSFWHHLTLDTRDDRVLPTRGLRLDWCKEFAVTAPAPAVVAASSGATTPRKGVAGSINFFRQWASASAHVPVFGAPGVSLAVSAKVGYLRPAPGDAREEQAPLFSSCDLLGFSNPLYCRAWDFYGAGREGRTESQAMAAAELRNRLQTLAAASVKLVFPLPFLRGDSWIRQNTKTHVFCDYGSLGEPADNSLSPSSLLLGSRLRCLSAGLGVAVRLGAHGRAELNYCLPVAETRPGGLPGFRGMQFGLGVTFL